MRVKAKKILNWSLHELRSQVAYVFVQKEINETIF